MCLNLPPEMENAHARRNWFVFVVFEIKADNYEV